MPGCDECGRAFAKPQGLHWHMVQVHGAESSSPPDKPQSFIEGHPQGCTCFKCYHRTTDTVTWKRDPDSPIKPHPRLTAGHNVVSDLSVTEDDRRTSSEIMGDPNHPNLTRPLYSPIEHKPVPTWEELGRPQSWAAMKPFVEQLQTRMNDRYRAALEDPWPLTDSLMKLIEQVEGMERKIGRVPRRPYAKSGNPLPPDHAELFENARNGIFHDHNGNRLTGKDEKIVRDAVTKAFVRDAVIHRNGDGA